MADPIPVDPAAIQSAFQQLQMSISNIQKVLGGVSGSARGVVKDFGDVVGSLAGLSAEAKNAVNVAADVLKGTYNASEALRKLREELNNSASANKEAALREKDKKDAMMKFDEVLRRMRSNFDISSTSLTEMTKRIRGGTLDLGTFTDQLLNSVGRFKYGWISAGLEMAKGLERMDIQVRKSTIGMMGIGEGRVRGAMGLGEMGGVGLRQYQATSELREASARSIMGLILMGKTAEQAADNIMGMTQIFGGSTRLIGTTLHFVSTEAALVASAFSKAANVSEQTARAATVNLVQKLGMSAQQAASTLTRFDSEAHKLNIGTELYTSWITELSQATINYTKDINFSQAIVRKFKDELASGVLTVQQFAQMTGGMRSADFGRQAGIMALAQQMGIRTPGLPQGAGPLAAVGFVGEKDTQGRLLGLQVQVLRGLAAQVAPAAGKGSLEAMGALRISMEALPALKNLQSLNNDVLQKVLNGTMGLNDLQKEIAKTEPPDPTTQMDNLITVAQNINLSTQTLGDAIKTTILGNAFRVFTVQIGPKEQENMELMKKQKEYQQAQQRDMAETKRMEVLAEKGTPEQKEQARRFLTERRERLQSQKEQQDREEQALVRQGVPQTEAHRLAAMAAQGRRGDPFSEKMAREQTVKAQQAAENVQYREKVEERFPDFTGDSKKAGFPPVPPAGGVSALTRRAAGSGDTALVARPQATPSLVTSPSGGASAQPRQSSSTNNVNVGVDVKVGLTGEDKESLIRRVLDEVEKSFRRSNVFGSGGQ